MPDAPGQGLRLQPGRDVHSVTGTLPRVEAEHVTEKDADAMLDRVAGVAH